MTRHEKIRLGDLLMQQRLISQEQLTEALEKQRQSGRKLGRILAENGFASDDEVSAAIAHQLQIPLVDLERVHTDSDLARLLPEHLARRFRAVVVENRQNAFLVAMADPTDLFAYQEIRDDLGWNVDVAVASESSLGHYIDRTYRHAGEAPPPLH
jgi:MSHA biogenesis protein MshE